MINKFWCLMRLKLCLFFFFSQARISLLQDEVSTNGIEDDALKRSVYKLNGRIDQGEKGVP